MRERCEQHAHCVVVVKGTAVSVEVRQAPARQLAHGRHAHDEWCFAEALSRKPRRLHAVTWRAVMWRQAEPSSQGCAGGAQAARLIACAGRRGAELLLLRARGKARARKHDGRRSSVAAVLSCLIAAAAAVATAAVPYQLQLRICQGVQKRQVSLPRQQ